MTPETERLITHGVSVRVRRAGAGAPLLFLHGANGWPPWLPFFDRLAQRYAVVLPEHPGFGASDDPKWLRTVPDLGMYYLDVLDRHFSSPVHIVGHSLGGWTAAEAAVRNCGRIASLTLLAPAGLRVKGISPADIFTWSPEEAAQHRFHDPNFREPLLDAAAVPANEEELDIQLQSRLAAVKFAWEPRLFNPDLEKWLHRITAPTHVVWGVEDKIVPSAYAAAWRNGIPDARFTMIEACGHSPHVERCGAVADKVVAFLEGGRR